MSTKTAVIYARVSSIGDRQSTDRQISDLLDYVEYQKLELSKVFEEHISGAKKNTERPILQQAIEFCKSNDVSILAQENKHAVKFYVRMAYMFSANFSLFAWNFR